MSSIRVDRRALILFGLLLAVGGQVLLGGFLTLTVAGLVLAGGATADILARRYEASSSVRSGIRAVTVLGAFGAILVWTASSGPLSLTLLFAVLFVSAGLALIRDIGPAWNSALPGLGFAVATGVSLVNGTPYAIYFAPIAFTFLWRGLQFGRDGRPGILEFHALPILVWAGLGLLGLLDDKIFVTLIALLIVGFMTWVAWRDRRRLRAAEA